MDRSMTLVFAVLLFLGGALAGRQIMTPDLRHSPPLPPAASPDFDSTDSNSPTMNLDLVKGETEPGNIKFAGFEQPIEPAPVESLSDAEIKSEIKKRFPDLPEDTVAGWVDAYRGSSANELRGLLNERQMLKGLFPTHNFPSPASDEQPDDATSPKR